MLIALDTSTAQMGLAVYDGVQVIAEMTWTSQQHHTVELAPALARLLNRAGSSMELVNALGVAIGPGSFTSLRVGLSFAKGLAFARHVPLVGIPTLDILAAAQPPSKHPLVAVIQAGRGRIAFGWYKHSKDSWQAEGSARSGTADELAEMIERPTHVTGELSAEDRQRLARKRVNVLLASPALCVRRPAVLAELAWTRWQSGKTDELPSLAPIYLHAAGTALA